VAGFSCRRFEHNGPYKVETKLTGSVSMETNRKGSCGSSWTSGPAEEEEEGEKE
jgi:hypothetical protein